MQSTGRAYGPGPATPGHIVLYISHLFDKKLAPSTITTKVSALSYFYKLMGSPDLVQHFLVQKALVGARKLAGTQDTRAPVTLTMLSQLMSHTSDVTDSPFEAILLKGMISLSFYGFLRPGEVTQSPNNLQLSSVKLIQDHILITFYKYKHHTGQPVTIKILAQGDPTCPVAALRLYLRERGSQPGPFFCYHSKFPVTYNQFHDWFHRLLTACNIHSALNLHSFRIGAASLAAANGISATMIQQMGRWRSAAYLRYIRIPQITLR